MAVRQDIRSQFDFDFEQEPYSYAAEKALLEKERSYEELEAAVKETPPRTGMSLSNGHGRNSSELRALGDVMDEGERLLPSGSPGLRHPKGRLETSKTSPAHSESFADVIKHESPAPPSPSTPSKAPNDRAKKRPSSIHEGFPRIVKEGIPSPVVTHFADMAKQNTIIAHVSTAREEAKGHVEHTPSSHIEESYANVVKHETHDEVEKKKNNNSANHTTNNDVHAMNGTSKQPLTVEQYIAMYQQDENKSELVRDDVKQRERSLDAKNTKHRASHMDGTSEPEGQHTAQAHQQSTNNRQHKSEDTHVDKKDAERHNPQLGVLNEPANHHAVEQDIHDSKDKQHNTKDVEQYARHDRDVVHTKQPDVSNVGTLATTEQDQHSRHDVHNNTKDAKQPEVSNTSALATAEQDQHDGHDVHHNTKDTNQHDGSNTSVLAAAKQDQHGGNDVQHSTKNTNQHDESNTGVLAAAKQDNYVQDDVQHNTEDTKQHDLNINSALVTAEQNQHNMENTDTPQDSTTPSKSENTSAQPAVAKSTDSKKQESIVSSILPETSLPTNTESDSDDRPKPEEDFADTATAVSDDDAAQSFVGTGQDATPRSPHRKAHKKTSSRSLNSVASKALQQALQETDTLPRGQAEKEEPLQEEETQRPGTLVYENYHSRSGTNLASVQLKPEYDESLSRKENKDVVSGSDTRISTVGAKANAKDSRLVSGRRAGAGWARSAIRWAPLNIPLQRRLQTLAVLGHSLSIAGLLALFFFLCTIPLFWPILLPYLIYVLLSRAPADGKLTHRTEWIRRSKFWSLFASYFPARLHRTVELEPTRKYIFGYHPHGIISHGAFAAFTTEALGFGQLFPGITNSLLTLESNFRVPLYRDWALRLGLASVSRESCENLLSRGGPNGEGMGRAITIVIGGARESLDAKPGTLNLVLAKRKGFVKLAVRTGADLVPVLAFGENDMYDQLDADTYPWVHKGQLMLKKFMGFTVPLFHARGIFNYDMGIMPYRRPINIVVGRPIRTAQSKKPDPAYVDMLHKQYTDELLHIWEEWKDVFAPQRNCELAIVE